MPCVLINSIFGRYIIMSPTDIAVVIVIANAGCTTCDNAMLPKPVPDNLA